MVLVVSVDKINVQTIFKIMKNRTIQNHGVFVFTQIQCLMLLSSNKYHKYNTKFDRCCSINVSIWYQKYNEFRMTATNTNMTI